MKDAAEREHEFVSDDGVGGDVFVVDPELERPVLREVVISDN